MSKRLEKEVLHGQTLTHDSPEKIWGWESFAGIKRFERRSEMLLSNIQQGMNVLEIGCGTGLLTLKLAETGCNVTAMDISPDLIELTKANCKHCKNITFTTGNAYDLEMESDSFEAIIGNSVLHHLDLDEALKEFIRVLKPGGIISFAEPNMLNPQICIQKNIPFIKKMMGDSPDETAFIKWHLKNKLAQYKFSNIKIRPFDFLHPRTPKLLTPSVMGIGKALEKLPLLKEMAGSLYIEAQKETVLN